jgi:hypothetical protein
MSDVQRRKVERLTLDEFAKRDVAPELAAVLNQLNGGSFMECHKLIATQTGVWIDELVPVFQKLDAALATRPLPAVVR